MVLLTTAGYMYDTQQRRASRGVRSCCRGPEKEGGGGEGGAQNGQGGREAEKAQQAKLRQDKKEAALGVGVLEYCVLSGLCGVCARRCRSVGGLI